MGETEKKKKIIEPIWFFKCYSIFQKRQQRIIWIMLIPFLVPFLLIWSLAFIPSHILVINLNSTNLFLLLFLYFLSAGFLYVLTRKYIIERGLDVNKYFWVEYFLGKIGLELYRLGNIEDYPHLIDFYNTSLRNWLLVMAVDYHGDTSGKKEMIYDLRRRLKSLAVYVDKNKYNSDRMFELGKKFFDLGENISKRNPTERINLKKLESLLNCFAESKPGILSHAQKIMTPEMVMALFGLLVGFLAGIISFYKASIPAFESIGLSIAITGLFLAIYTFVKRK
jgi:hypothetical protein